MNSRFNLIKAFKDGHRFYTDSLYGKIVIADQSAYDYRTGVDLGPDKTDDGVVFLDFSRNITVVPSGAYLVPVRLANLDECQTIASKEEAEWLRQTFRFLVVEPNQDVVSSYGYEVKFNSGQPVLLRDGRIIASINFYDYDDEVMVS